MPQLTIDDQTSRLPRIWLLVSLINLFLAACLGAILRFVFVTEIPGVSYTHFMHAHSHTAMLGWLYLALFALMIRFYLPNEEGVYRRYNRLFWLTQLSVFGMLVSFIYQSYGPVSIAFSSLHGILSYIFVYKFWRDLGKPSPANRISFKFAKASMFFLILSTLTLWAMPIVIIIGESRSALYYASVQFYLHFQFNGWFIFGILGLLFYFLESKSVSFSEKGANLFFRLLVISCLLTYVLAVTWSNPIQALFYINSAGVIIQLAALVIFISVLWPVLPEIKKHFSGITFTLIGVSGICFLAKILIQSAVIIPSIAQVGYTIRNYVLGFLHLMLLGMVSCFLLAFSAQNGLFKYSSSSTRIGIWLFLIGFVGSEGYLFLQGTMFWAALGFLPYYYEGLAIISAFIPIGVLFMIFPQLGHGGKESVSIP